MKKPTTFEQQLEIMKSRGLIIDDEAKCLDVLRSVNYYRFSAYLLPFRKKDQTYFSGINFERVYNIYEFDRNVRTLLFSVIEEIELYLRTQLAYYSACYHGALGYLDPEYYNDKHDHERFLNVLDTAIADHRNTPVVKHHNAKYNGLFPIWVIVDFMSIGNLSYFYSDLQSDDKKEIAKDLFNTTYPYLESWLKCITVLRNRCAHYSRLYYSMFTDKPRIQPSLNYACSGRLFDQLLMLKFLYPNPTIWDSGFVKQLHYHVEDYKEHISLSHIGFPENWKDILANKVKQILFST